MTLSYPFQKIHVISSGASNKQILLAASGPQLSALSLRDGKILNHWPNQDGFDHLQATEDDTKETEETVVGDRPAKRRKFDSAEENGQGPGRRLSDVSDESVEIVAERKKGDRRRPKKAIDEKTPTISHVLATRDGQNIIVVTTENKAISVLELKHNGRLRTLSERCLPKKLCAIKLTKDESTILAADKFGDVYALPLHPSDKWVAKQVDHTSQAVFKPSATELTVHTKGNLHALRQQLELKHIKQRKEGPNFEHQVVLGHVSLLTDLEIAEGFVDQRPRPFILTADRDEHIRISRSIPQAHIIETYCLGHREFISKLCVLPWAPEILVAGNGEPSLKTYEWQAGKLLSDLSLRDVALSSDTGTLRQEESKSEKLAVSGIWPVNISHDTTLTSLFQANGVILVAFEGLPHLHTFSYNDAQKLQHRNTYELQGNVLDVTQIPGTNQILVSWDFAHESGSIKIYRSAEEVDSAGLQRLELKVKQGTDPGGDQIPNILWEEVDHSIDPQTARDCLSAMIVPEPTPSSKNEDEEKRKIKAEGKTYSQLGEFLYGLENLRKKRDIVNDDESIGADAASNI